MRFGDSHCVTETIPSYESEEREAGRLREKVVAENEITGSFWGESRRQKKSGAKTQAATPSDHECGEWRKGRIRMKKAKCDVTSLYPSLHVIVRETVDVKDGGVERE